MADPNLAEGTRRQQKRDFILDRLASWSKMHNKEEIVIGAQTRRVPASPVATVLELARDPRLMARGFLRKINHPLFGEIEFPMGAMACANGVALGAAPTFGQHTVSVLKEVGYSRSAIHSRPESDSR